MVREDLHPRRDTLERVAKTNEAVAGVSRLNAREKRVFRVRRALRGRPAASAWRTTIWGRVEKKGRMQRWS